MNRLQRRTWLCATGGGLGSLALRGMLHAESKPSHALHHTPTAKSVIFLFMSGGPSQVDTFDPKPELQRLAGKDVPESIARHVPPIKRAGLKNIMASPWGFQNYGDAGIPISDLLPETAKYADKLCVIRSMQHRNPVHGPGECVALTGTAAGNRPSIGAWSIYGLGSANDNLPSFIGMNLLSDGMQYPQASGWGTGFLPARFQGTIVSPREGIRHVELPKGITEEDRRKQLDLIGWFNRRHRDQQASAGELDARLRSYESAFRMQTAAPELFDLSAESEATRKLYGIDQKQTEDVGRACLLARRMVQRDVRFVQIRVGGWDAHGNLKGNHEKMAARTDRPIAGLLGDLQQRGLLESTLVVWAGEFGRTPTMEGRGKGRDHSPAGYSVWFAGGGARGGTVIGATDPLGYVAVERPVSPHDFHATILHALGLDASRLTFSHHGRQEIPTVFGGQAVSEVFSG